MTADDRPGTDAETTADGHGAADDSEGRRAEPTACRSSDRRVDRRTLISTGAAGLAAALAGCSGGDSGDDPDETPDEPADDAGGADDPDGPDRDPPEEPPAQDPHADIPYAEEYGTVVDVVADVGADPEGEASIVPILEERAGDDTLLYFPPGRYLVDDVWRKPSFEHLAFVGDDATIVPQRGSFGYLLLFGLPDHHAVDLRFEGFEYDFTAQDTAPRPLQAQIDDGLHVEDVSVRGIGGTARFDLTSPHGTGVVRNLRMPDGGREPNPVGVLVGPANEGRLRFEDCHVAGFPGNGLYASPSNGPIEVIGGTYANNGIASVRVSSPATVRDVTVRCDEAPEGFRNMRGIRLRHGESVLVENCRIVMEELTYADGGLVIEPMMQSATIRDLEIDCSVDDYPAIHVKTPRHDAGDAEIEFERVTVTGDAGQGKAVEIADRANCRLETLDIEQSGADRDGVHLIRTTDSVLRNSEIDVTGDPLVLEESQLRRTNNRL